MQNYTNTGLPVDLKLLKCCGCPEIVLKLAIVLKFYSFGQNVLIRTFVTLSLWHCIHFVLYLVNNMQSVKVAQMMLKAGNEKLQETAKKLDASGAKQRDLRKRLHEHDTKDVPPAKKMKT